MKFQATGNHGSILVTKVKDGWFVQRRMALHAPSNQTNEGYVNFALESNTVSDPKHELDPNVFLFDDEKFITKK